MLTAAGGADTGVAPVDNAVPGSPMEALRAALKRESEKACARCRKPFVGKVRFQDCGWQFGGCTDPRGVYAPVRLCLRCHEVISASGRARYRLQFQACQQAREFRGKFWRKLRRQQASASGSRVATPSATTISAALTTPNNT
jgi:hypothetical protein